MDNHARKSNHSLDEVQAENRAWWTTNPMRYDWHHTLGSQPMTERWFDEIDERFTSATFPYLSTKTPFDRVMPTDLRGLRVLEVGCGMGLHTELLVRRGAMVTAIDLTEPAVETTARRLELRTLSGTVRQADAERLPFDDDSFDLVWSWGVIHHSSHTARIVRQISRVLTPKGEARIMVYNRDSRIARLHLLRHYVLGRGYKTKTVDEVLWEQTDGFMARYFTTDTFDDLLRGFFRESLTQIYGQEPDVVPLPARFRGLVAGRLTSEQKLVAASKYGAFLFSIANNPLRG